MDTIEVLAIGSEVTIDGEIPATIRRIEIRGAGEVKIVNYECAWWDERVRKTEWLEIDEIKVLPGHPKNTIRFK